MSNPLVEKYGAAIATGDIHKIGDLLSANVIIMPPGSNQPNEGKAKACSMLSTLAVVVDDLKSVRIYDNGHDWHTVLFEGFLDGTAVQFIDQVHMDESNAVDHVDIFLRPASMGQILLAKVTAEITRRASV